MERQDTQPFISDEDMSFLLHMSPSFMSDQLTLFDPLQESDDKCNSGNDEQLPLQQSQQHQPEQLILLQQQQHQYLLLQRQQQLMLNNSQNGQKNIKVPQHMAVAAVKQEIIDGPGISFLSSDSLSSTPPEMLRGVPYSAVHTITSDAVNGSMAGGYSAASGPSASSSSQAFHDERNAHCTDSNMPSAFNNHISCGSSLQQQAHNTSQFEPLWQNQVPQVHNTHPGMCQSKGGSMAILSTRSQCNLASEPFSSMEPFSPATQETSDVIATLAEEKCIPQSVEQQRHLIGLPDVQEKKFAPQEQKFILPSSSNEIMSRAGGCGGGLDSINPGLTRAKTIDVTTLNNWPGDYDFQIKVVPNDKHNKWCYSSKVHRLYCYPMLAAEVQVSVNDWMEASNNKAEVRLVAVYQDAQNRTKPVQRCHNCTKSDKTSLDLMEHMVQVSNSGAVHGVTGSRYTVSVPMERSHRGEDNVTLLIRCTCMSSCVGGPNRRPFALLFSLMMNGEEKGRQVLSTKCCKGPNRDIKKDEADHDRQLGLVVENTSNAPPSDPRAKCSPKKANLAIAGSSGLHVALSSPKSAVTKRKSTSKKLLIPGDLFSSDSETDRSGSKKTKLGSSSGRGIVAIPEGYVTLLVPAEFKNDIIKYTEGLAAIKYMKNNKLNVPKSVDLL